MTDVPEELQIDRYRLDEECFQQSTLMYAAAENVADLQNAYDRAKEQLDLVRAQCESEIRKNPSKFNMVKATDKSVEARVVMLARYQQAVSDMLDAKHALALGRARVTALEHKKRGLEKAIDLFLAEYFSDVKSKSIDKEVEATATRRRIRRRKQTSKEE